jgi:nucleotide-binding universal stress UspA family protein
LKAPRKGEYAYALLGGFGRLFYSCSIQAAKLLRRLIMLRSILVGLDGSDYSKAAVELGIQWAKRYDALIVGLGIVDEPAIRRPESMPIGASYFKLERDQALITDAQHQVETFLDTFGQHCAREGVKYTTIKETGRPVSEILRQSRSYDLIMLGQNTHFSFETQEGADETIWQVVRQSSRPVVTVPESLRTQRSNCVLVAYDASPEADRALQAFEGLGLSQRAEIHVLSIDADCDTANSLANQAATFMNLHDVNAIFHCGTAVGTPSGVILNTADLLNAGLIVMGACGRARWREVIFGSTTSEVVEGSEVPVFLCH